TPGTPLAGAPAPSPGDAVSAVSLALRLFGGEVGIGCMRPPSLKDELDPAAVSMGVDRIANPRPSLVRSAGLAVVDSCCSVPRELLRRFL
ncbi:MAG: radical SAM protein, partial [Thermoproteota archaeon]